MSLSLPQASGYSGSAHEGLNMTAGYHRMTYENRTKIHTPQELIDTILTIYEVFQKSNRSRLVVRTVTQANDFELNEIKRVIQTTMNGSVSFYPDYSAPDSNIWYITFAINRRDRDIDSSAKKYLEMLNFQYRERVFNEIGDFESHSLLRLQGFRENGYELVRDINPLELQKIWLPFGWSETACEEILRSKSGDFVLGVREKNKKLVASILYSHQPHKLSDGRIVNHGELTESSTLPEYRGKGIMGILATALHVEAVTRGTANIYGEYRALGGGTGPNIQSIRYAIESGVTFPSENLLVNHVDIDGDPDPHNIGRVVEGYDGESNKLRCFSLGSLNPNLLSERLRNQYLSLLHN